MWLVEVPDEKSIRTARANTQRAAKQQGIKPGERVERIRFDCNDVSSSALGSRGSRVRYFNEVVIHLSLVLAPERQAHVHQKGDPETEEPGVVVQLRPERRRLDQADSR